MDLSTWYFVLCFVSPSNARFRRENKAQSTKLKAQKRCIAPAAESLLTPINNSAAPAAVSAVLVLGGVGVATGGVLHAIKQGVSLSGKKPLDQISGSAGTKSLPTNPIPLSLPSVTERTAQLLPNDEPRATP